MGWWFLEELQLACTELLGETGNQGPLKTTQIQYTVLPLQKLDLWGDTVKGCDWAMTLCWLWWNIKEQRKSWYQNVSSLCSNVSYHLGEKKGTFPWARKEIGDICVDAKMLVVAMFATWDKTFFIKPNIVYNLRGKVVSMHAFVTLLG